MTPDIDITTDEFGTMTIDVKLLGAQVETIKISTVSVNALRAYFAEEATNA